MMKMRTLGVIFAVIAVGGCAMLSPDAPRLYTVTATRDFAEAPGKADWQLAVEVPTASGTLDTTRIMTVRHKTDVDPIADVAWTDRAPQMMQSKIVESFENAGGLLSVGREAMGARADFVLKTELRDFQGEYDDAAAGLPRQVRVRLVAKLMAMPRRTIEAGETFEAVAPVAGTDFGAVIAAFDQANAEVLGHLVPWTIAAGNRVAVKAKSEATPARRGVLD